MNRAPTFVSVIVPTYRREAMLRETLDSVLALDHPNFEVIVYDQSPSHEPDTVRYLEQFAQRGNCHVYRDRIASLPRARNAAFLRSRGDIILFIDDDVLLPRDFIQRHLKPYEKERVAAVAGRIVYPGEDPGAQRPLPVSARAARDRVDLQIMRHTTPIMNPLHIGGGNFSVRRCWMEANGGFSNTMHGSALGEDIEFAGRLRRRGGVIVYDPDAWLIHRVDPSGGCRIDDASQFARQRDRMRNFYYAIFHGAGWKRGIAVWKRRIRNRVTGGELPRDGGAATPRRSLFGRGAAAAGRFFGAAEGIARSLSHRGTWGDLKALRSPSISSRKPPFISVVIATLNRERILCETITSILAQDYPDFEIIVVDQTEKHDDETQRFLHVHHAEGRIRWIRESIKGASRARNIGAYYAKGDVLLFVDDDVTALPGLISAHARRYHDSPRHWCTGGRIVRPWENPDAAKPFPRGVNPLGFEAPVCYHTTPFPDVLHVITCNLSIRRDVFVMIGGFDEWYHNYGEDLDLIGRLREAGGRAAYDPAPALIHHVAPSGGTRIARGDAYAVGRSRGVYHHYSVLRVVGLRGWLGVTIGRIGGQAGRFTARLLGRRREREHGPVDELMARGRTGALSAVSYKLKQAAGSALAFIEALRLLRAGKRTRGDYFRTAAQAKKKRGQSARAGESSTTS